MGNIAGVVARIKEVSKKCTSSHCVLHRHSLATKKVPVVLKQVLDNAVKIINYIKTRPLQSRLLKILCEDMGAVHKSLLLHTEDAQESIQKNCEWIINPFSVTSKPAALNAAEYEVFIDMVSESHNQTSFKNKPISEFWAQLGEDFSVLRSKAKLLLLPFGTTYLCEMAFSRYTATKTKYRARLNAEDDMHLQLTSVTPDIDKLSRKKQAHCSH
ncbi:zinc finger BED domain-containing protein 5-like [Daktulosphaira vitifoliae]|uniref:zinc finger BED domain-containing protein 5-like n=1 Tax=Daktulosphaira vitifoliae TaxID=58002 RepID=UPI0021A9C400|nr:zinc finger BED domain-containing protein 5-like [Daktulosphaira vitifoliae]